MSDFLLHGTTLALAWFLLLNVATAAAFAAVAARVTRHQRVASPGFWLAMRLTPAALSIAFVLIVFVPSYWRFEPRESVEGFDLSLTLLAMLALSILAAAGARGVSAWRRVARRTNAWMRASRPLTLDGTPIPAFAIDTDTPVMALVGVLRPRLLIARPVLEALTAEELRAGIKHELGHCRAWDNLKRLAMRAAPDVLSATPLARAIERRWAAASEQVADRGAGDSGRERCELASALVKVARLMPPATSISEPISALVDGDDISTRVQRLLDDAPPLPGGGWTPWLALGVPTLALLVSYSPLLRMIHGMTELLVNRLP